MAKGEYTAIIRNRYRISSKEEGMSSTSGSMTAVQRRALKLWQVLIGRASNRQTITYGELAATIGNEVPPPAVGGYLDLVAGFCRSNGMPDITVLTVNKETGRPSKEERGVDVYRERENVYDHSWYALTPPTPEDFPSTLSG